MWYWSLKHNSLDGHPFNIIGHFRVRVCLLFKVTLGARAIFLSRSERTLSDLESLSVLSDLEKKFLWHPGYFKVSLSAKFLCW